MRVRVFNCSRSSCSIQWCWVLRRATARTPFASFPCFLTDWCLSGYVPGTEGSLPLFSSCCPRYQWDTTPPPTTLTFSHILFSFIKESHILFIFVCTRQAVAAFSVLRSLDEGEYVSEIDKDWTHCSQQHYKQYTKKKKRKKETNGFLSFHFTFFIFHSFSKLFKSSLLNVLLFKYVLNLIYLEFHVQKSLGKQYDF